MPKMLRVGFAASKPRNRAGYMQRTSIATIHKKIKLSIASATFGRRQHGTAQPHFVLQPETDGFTAAGCSKIQYPLVRRCREVPA